jgi:hypothetical protein
MSSSEPAALNSSRQPAISSRSAARLQPPAGARRRALFGIVAFLLLAGVAARAQVPEGWQQGMRFQREMVPAQQKGFMFCRLMFNSVRSEPSGIGWSTDYPMADRNLMIRLSEFTTASVNRYEDGEPAHAVVRATDAELFRCPFLFASDAGTAGFDADEAERLRTYLLKGGFLWVDDFWGNQAMSHWLSQMVQVVPEGERVMLDPSHPLFSSFYFLDGIPQIPNIQFWRRSGGATSERGAETAVPTMSAIVDDRGRVLVLMTHNTDIADGWEREGEEYAFFARFSPHAYAVGINVAVFAMTR